MIKEDNVIFFNKWCEPGSLTHLLEYKYLEQILINLKSIMGPDFRKYRFFIYSYIYGCDSPTINAYSFNPTSDILILLSDEKSTIPNVLSPYFKIIFKAYLPVAIIDNIYPFPLGYAASLDDNYSLKDANNRDYNVFFSGYLNNNRLTMYKNILELSYIPTIVFRLLRRLSPKLLPTKLSNKIENSFLEFTSGFNHGLDNKTYSKLLSRSKIVLCPKGFYSPETFRHYEAMKAGCIVISEKLPDNHFYTNSPFIIISNWRALKPLISSLLQDKEKLIKLQKDTLEWWNNNCSEIAIANYIYEKINCNSDLN